MLINGPLSRAPKHSPLRIVVMLVSGGRPPDLSEQHPEVVVRQVRRNFGQTAALAAGLEASQGDIVIFMDGDLQNDPAEIPRLVETMESGGYDVVSGWRKNRQDAAIS